MASLPDLAKEPQVKLQLALGEFNSRQKVDSSLILEEFTSRFSEISDQLRAKLGRVDEQHADPTSPQTLDRGNEPGEYQSNSLALSKIAASRDNKYGMQVNECTAPLPDVTTDSVLVPDATLHFSMRTADGNIQRLATTDGLKNCGE